MLSISPKKGMISPFLGLIKLSVHHSVLISVAGESSLKTCSTFIFTLSLTKPASRNTVRRELLGEVLVEAGGQLHPIKRRRPVPDQGR